MAAYRVEIGRSAANDLEGLQPQQASRIVAALEALADEPRPRKSRKLTGSDNSYRIRVGNYRILYQIDDPDKVVSVFAVGHRKDVYR